MSAKHAMSAKDIAERGNAGLAHSEDRRDASLVGRKSVLIGMLTSGFVLASAAPSATAGTVKPSTIAATQSAYIPKWTPSTAYAAGQQVISPTNDVVSAKVAHTSSTTYGTSTTKWAVSATPGTINVRTHGALGDGTTDDTAAIQSALTTAGATAVKEVVIPPGTFLFTALTVPTGVTLRGLGGTLKLKDDTCKDAAVAYYPIYITPGTSNVTIRDLNIDGNGANNTAALVADVITVIGDNHRIIDNTIVNSPDSGIMFSKVTNSECSRNRIDAGGDVGIYVNDGDGTLFHENVIEGNRITNYPNGGIALKRITQRCAVANNVINNCGNGITLENGSSGTDYSRNMTIIGNRIRHIGYAPFDTAAGRGINLRGSNHVVCVSNSMEDIARANIMMEASSYCTVEGNVIEGTASGVAPYSIGIDIKDRDNVGCSYNTIVGNTIKGAAYAGITVSRTGTGVSSWNILNGNIVASQGRTPIGMLLSGDAAQDNTITGNILSGETSDLNFNATSVRNLMGNNTLVHGLTAGTPGATSSTAFLRMHDKTLTSGTTVPTAGTWTAGDICLMRNPGNGGLVGWVCVAAGTPGVWRPFGHSQLSGMAAWDPPSLANGATAATTVAVAGALVTDIAEASLSSIGANSVQLSAHVSAPGIVRVQLLNNSGGVLDIASGTLTVNCRRIV